ncbi:NlpC/P60 family protein, partial [Geodermatophilus sp. CPCC 206100]
MATPRTARPAAWRRAAVVLAGALALAGVPAAAGAEPGTAQEAARLVAERGHQLEVVTEQFNEARVELDARRRAADEAAAAVAGAQAAVDAAQGQVAGVARTAFTGESMGSLRALLTSGSADEFVNRVNLLDAVAGHQGELLRQAAAAGEAAAQARVVADRAAGEAQAQYDTVAGQQADLQGQITEYQAQYARLSAEERRAALAAAATAHAATPERASRAEREAP